MPMIPVKEATKGVAIAEPEVKEHAVDLLIVGRPLRLPGELPFA